MSSPLPEEAEWLEADGLGGFASGTVSGRRTRRYHALLLTATTPPTGRVVLVNGFDADIETTSGRYAVTSQRYSPDVIHPDGAGRIGAFSTEPWPQWRFDLPNGAHVTQEILVPKGASVVVLKWSAEGVDGSATLRVRPFLSGRDYHSLHHENPAFRFDAEHDGDRVRWHPYPDRPAVIARANGSYRHSPDWYRNFSYLRERERGLDDTEDLATPGEFTFDLSSGPAVLVLAAEGYDREWASRSSAEVIANEAIKQERKRRQFPSRLHRAADAYLVQREQGRTIVAGYPWFTDWGRDTFIAMRGLCLATGRLREARDILLEWAATVSQGMLPNRFPDSGGEPEFNAVDASLWFIIAAHELLEATAGKRVVSAADKRRLQDAMESILSGYAAGTRFGIRMDDDALLAAGVPGVQLTWMDARVGDWVVTPRIGKPVEVQALWINALLIGARWSSRWRELGEQARTAFITKFWDDRRGHLADVVDVDHQRGRVDESFRPNQIVAVGGLPVGLLDEERSQRIVDAVESRLWTRLGLRSLAPGSPGYAPYYRGGVTERDGAYHQGTVWPWLIGPFVDAWLRAHGDTAESRERARRKFLEPLLDQLDVAGLGHLPEVADGEVPHIPGGCPFQAWSVGEALRVVSRLLQ